jgi:hypothetical protein
MFHFVTFGNHFIIGEDIYTVLTGNLNQFRPGACQFLNPDSPVLVDIWHMNWILNEVPFMPLVLLNMPFYGLLFQRLNYTSKMFPLERHGTSWSLNHGVVDEWIALERNMHSVFLVINEVCIVPMPTLFQYWALPTQYGYEFYYHSPRETRIIASCSRDSFIPLMAALTFVFLIANDLAYTEENFTWCEKVLEKTGIHPQWLSALKYSVVCDMTVP